MEEATLPGGFLSAPSGLARSALPLGIVNWLLLAVVLFAWRPYGSVFGGPAWVGVMVVVAFLGALLTGALAIAGGYRGRRRAPVGSRERRLASWSWAIGMLGFGIAAGIYAAIALFLGR